MELLTREQEDSLIETADSLPSGEIDDTPFREFYSRMRFENYCLMLQILDRKAKEAQQEGHPVLKF